MSNLKIIEVKSNKDLDLFVSFPWQIYKNFENWVPPLKSEIKNIFADKNPFWRHSEKKLFLLFDNGKIVGRIAGIIDYNYIKFQDENAGFFGFFECENNLEYASHLVRAVQDWLSANKIRIIYGPMNPSTNDEMGFLFEGEGDPFIMMPYNPSYYLELFENLGFEKARDLYAYNLDYKNTPFKRLNFLRDKLLEKFKYKNVKVRSINLKNLDHEIEFALDVYNDAWEKNWGFVPWNSEEFYSVAKMLKNLADPRMILFLEIDSKPAGMLIVIPDYNQVMKKLNGKLNILKFLWYKRKITRARLLILGVKKEFRKQGFESLLYLTAAENVRETGIRNFEFSWILEDNVLTCRAAEMMGGELYRKYRVFRKDNF